MNYWYLTITSANTYEGISLTTIQADSYHEALTQTFKYIEEKLKVEFTDYTYVQTDKHYNNCIVHANDGSFFASLLPDLRK